jgi:hypothetical protein
MEPFVLPLALGRSLPVAVFIVKSRARNRATQAFIAMARTVSNHQ